MKTLKDISIKGFVDADQFLDFESKLKKCGLTQSAVIRDLAVTWARQTDNEVEHFFDAQFISNIQKQFAHIKSASLKIERPKCGLKPSMPVRGRARFHQRL
ncbi:hypothetical protein [Undibacterium sp.]|uniref:hypothetical protein n=1 Tax=Undibacterium sp. TaxID=1914977 RepID=UPI0037506B0A